MNKLFIAGILSIALAAAGCGGETKADKADYLNAKLSAALPGFSFSTAKLNTDRGGNWVVITQLESGSATSTYAINLDVINTRMSALEVYSAVVSSDYEQVTRIGVSNSFIGSSSGLVYEETAATGKDLEKAAAAAEAMRLGALAQSLSADYGLSEDRGFQVAKLSMSWSKLSRTRAMTDADAEAFSTDLLGVSLSQAERAYAQARAGDESALDGLISRAASVNGVSPEQMSRIVSEVIAR